MNHLSWENSIILELGERIVASWRGSWDISPPPGEVGTTTKNGLLVLTTQRLIFLEERGIFGKSYHKALEILLLKVGGISMGGMFSPFVSIVDDKENHIFHVSRIGKKEFESFRQLIAAQCKERREEIESERKRERVQVVLDFSSLRDYMEKGGLVLQKTKCPECGAPISLPKAGTETQCTHCGSKIYAQDIFEKVRSLIG
jgi:ribosomal protein S27AE